MTPNLRRSFYLTIGSSEAPVNLLGMDEQYTEILFALCACIIISGILLAVVRFRSNSQTNCAHPHQPVSVQDRGSWQQYSGEWRISRNLTRSNIGIFCNEWRQPTSEFGPDEEEMEDSLEIQFGQFNIPKAQWDKATKLVDMVLEMVLYEMKTEARKYEGLVVEKYIRQGSSREGLKVGKPDEFDNLVQFHIEGLNFQMDPVKTRCGKSVSELAHLVVTDNLWTLQVKFPKLYGYGVFFSHNDRTYLNARRLHEQVFTSIIDKARSTVANKVNDPVDANKFGFKIHRKLNAPSVNITIKMLPKDDSYDAMDRVASVHSEYITPESSPRVPQGGTEIDVDLVPGLLLQNDVIPDPCSRDQTMHCPRYLVAKWVTDNHPSAIRYPISPGVIWRNCSSGYEKHLLDIAHGDTDQRYIITAVRIAKAYFQWRKNRYCGIDRGSHPPPQIVTVLRSYHLKHVGFYCILYLTVLNKVRLTGVKQALAFLLDFLEICLEVERLPHFFHANAWISYMFPDYDVGDESSLRYDLFIGKSSDALRQAKLAFRNEMREELLQFYDGCFHHEDLNDKFRDYLKSGNYYN